MPKRVLFMSNGHGEDTVGARIAMALGNLDPGAEIGAFPIVGVGNPYKSAGFPVVGPTRVMPSGGFLYQSARYMIRDLASGLLALTIRQLLSLRSLRPHFDMVVGVGDNVPLFFNALALKLPMVFVGIARSARYKDGRNPYSGLECKVMRKYCRKVFVRDPETRDSLLRDRVDASYAGNPMMDCIDLSHRLPDFARTRNLIGVLPGSREEAYSHIEFLLPVIGNFARCFDEPVTFAFALANTLDLGRIARLADSAFSGRGVERSTYPGAGGGEILVYHLENGSGILFARNLFGDIISSSAVVIGLSGTGNEQAAGMGRPIITFPGDGPQITAKFVRKQKKLLGGALSVVNRDPGEIAGELERLLRDPERREAMGMEGRKAIEGRGSCTEIARQVIMALS
ncbi:MAG TPA: hypothetical protein GX506_01680 [Firmicutes bacterium]|nr:hypothetical protein [Bacillota bacterium]